MMPGQTKTSRTVGTPLEVTGQREPKGLYRLARRGELVEFTRIDPRCEPPPTPGTPDLQLDATSATVITPSATVGEAVLACCGRD